MSHMGSKWIWIGAVFILSWAPRVSGDENQHAPIFDLNSTADIANGWEGMKTERMIDLNEGHSSQGQSVAEQENIQRNRRDRAKEVAKLIQGAGQKNLEGQLALEWNSVLRDHPGMKGPASVVGVGAGLWLGRDWVIAKNSAMVLRSHLEVRSRSGRLQWSNSELDGQVGVSHGTDVDLKISRTFQWIRAIANLTYRFRQNEFCTQLSHELVKHLALTFTATQAQVASADARFSYEIKF